MNRRILVTVLLASGCAFAADAVRPKSGPELKGTIKRLEIDAVEIDAGGAKTLRPEEVAGFTLGDVPPKQREAESSMNARKFDDAIKSYQTAIKELKAGRGDIHRQFLYQGLIRAQKAKNDDGLFDTVMLFLKECPKAWNYAEVAREGIEYAKSKRNDAKAKEIINTMRAAADPMKGYGTIEHARLAIASKDFSGAQTTLAAIANNNNQPYAVDAKVWLIRALRGKKDTASLDPMCKGILGQKDVPAALLQAAASGMGDALMEKAKGGDRAALRDAMVAYGKAISVGPPQKDQPADDYANALLNQARCYVLAGKGGKEPQAKPKAQSYYVEVMQRYGDTDWAAAAKKECDALGAEASPTDGEQK